jgi:hypothetical protein
MNSLGRYPVLSVLLSPFRRPGQKTCAALVGEVAQYEDKYRLCYVRGLAGVIVALAEELF